MVCGMSWEGLEGVKDVMEYILSSLFDPTLVMMLIIQENNLGANHVGSAYEQKLLLELFCNECLMQNHIRAVGGEGPLVYKEAKDMFEEVWQATCQQCLKRPRPSQEV